MNEKRVMLSMTFQESVVVAAALRVQSNRLKESAQYVLGNKPIPEMEAIATEALQDSNTMYRIAKRIEKARAK